MKKISAEIVADSISPQGHRLTTMLLTYPRFIHGEVMTHRLFSRNSASSRAIPFKKMVKMVEEDPFIPIAWQKEHKGMQGNEYFTDESQISSKISCWLNARDHALRSAKYLNSDLVVYKIGDETFTSFNQTDEDSVEQLMAEKRLENTKVTKQLCNRLLEPFMWHTVLVTATEWDNFFELRCPKYQWQDGKVFNSWKDLVADAFNNGASRDWVDGLENCPLIERLNHSKSQAEIHIQALAEAMWDVMSESTPKKLQAGEWHIPFGDKIDYALHKWNFLPNITELWGKDMSEYGIKIATARCARLSYMTFDGEIDYEKDIKLHDQLIGPPFHASPFEHCARAMHNQEYKEFIKGKVYRELENHDYIEIPENTEGWCNNFKGFIPYRYLIENEQ